MCTAVGLCLLLITGETLVISTTCIKGMPTNADGKIQIVTIFSYINIHPHFRTRMHYSVFSREITCAPLLFIEIMLSTLREWEVACPLLIYALGKANNYVQVELTEINRFLISSTLGVETCTHKQQPVKKKLSVDYLKSIKSIISQNTTNQP